MVSFKPLWVSDTLGELVQYITGQIAPFTKKFGELGWDLQEFKFLGRPVDGVQFQDDEVIIVEFKTGAAQLTPRQRNIKKLIAEGKVRFEEIRF